jgi:hypothetical protein
MKSFLGRNIATVVFLLSAATPMVSGAFCGLSLGPKLIPTYESARVAPELLSRFGSPVTGVEEVTLSVRNRGSSQPARKVILHSLSTHGEVLNEKEVFKDESDLIIGIDATGNTHGHLYMIINGVRVDGRMFFGAHSEAEKNWRISDGLVIRYKNLPAKEKAALLKWLQSDEIVKAATCVQAACKILYDIAGFSNAPKRNFLFPSSFLSHLNEYGILGENGQRLFPEIYTINRDARTFWDELPTVGTVPFFLFKVLLDPYTWSGGKKKDSGTAKGD